MSEVAKLERELDKIQEAVARKELAERLMANSDFRELILKYFCTEECARYVQVSTDPLIGATERADALNMAQAAGHLKRFLQLVVQIGNISEGNREDCEAALAEARAEEDAA